MDRSEEEEHAQSETTLDRHVRELLERTFVPLPPATTELGRHALNGTPPESVIDARVYEDGAPERNDPPEEQ